MQGQKDLNPHAPEYRPASSSSSSRTAMICAGTTIPPSKALNSVTSSLHPSSLPYSFSPCSTSHYHGPCYPPHYPKQPSSIYWSTNLINYLNPFPLSYNNSSPPTRPQLSLPPPVTLPLSSNASLSGSSTERYSQARSTGEGGILGTITPKPSPSGDFSRRLNRAWKAAGPRGRGGGRRGNGGRGNLRPGLEAAAAGTRRIIMSGSGEGGCKEYMNRKSSNSFPSSKDVTGIGRRGGGGGTAGCSIGHCAGDRKYEKHNPVIEGGKETSVMIRNIPNQFTRDMFIDYLDVFCRKVNGWEKNDDGSCGTTTNRIAAWEEGDVGAKTDDLKERQAEVGEPVAAFDFLYLPIDFRTKQNKGFAFVNFTSSRAVWMLHLANENDRSWGQFDSHRKKRDVCLADVQGKEALLKLVGRTSFPPDNDDYLPVCFNPPRDGCYSRSFYQIMKGGERQVSSSSSQPPQPPQPPPSPPSPPVPLHHHHYLPCVRSGKRFVWKPCGSKIRPKASSSSYHKIINLGKC